MSEPSHKTLTNADAPIVDRYAGSAVRGLADVANWVRDIERTARVLQNSLASAVASGNPTALATETCAAVGELLEDGDDGPIARTLRRPPQHLGVGSTARRVLTKRADVTFERARLALNLHPKVMELSRAIAGVRDTFGANLPTLMKEHLERARLAPADLRRLRSNDAIDSAFQRLGRVRDILGRYLEELPASGAEAELTIDLAARLGALTLPELKSAFRIAARERRGFRASSRVDSRARELSRQLVNAQAESSETACGLGPEALVMEELARLALDDRAAATRDGSDIPLWTGAIAAGHNAAFPNGSRYAWRPPSGSITAESIANSEELSDAHPEAAWYAIPVIRDYVCLQQEEPSAIRVWSRGMRVEGEAECVLTANFGTIEDSRLALHDVPTFFDNLDEEHSGWYRTTRRAVVSILFADEDRFFARVTRRGELERIDEAPWRDAVAGTDSVRILCESRRPSSQADRDENADVVHPIGVTSTFLGVESRSVLTPFADHLTALVRTPTDRTATARHAVDRERDLFAELELESPARGRRFSVPALRYRTHARVGRSTAQWPIYAVPFGLTMDAMPAIETWIRQSVESMVGTLQSVARVVAATNVAGFALGLCHSACFAFRPRFTRLDSAPVPDVLLSRAPAATRFGQSFGPVPAAGAGDSFSRLGIDPVPPAVRGRELAQPHVDALAFGAFMLDLIAKEKLPSRPDTSWASLQHVVGDVANTHFLYPELALALAERLCDREPRGGAALYEVLRHVASAPRLDLKSLAVAV